MSLEAARVWSTNSSESPKNWMGGMMARCCTEDPNVRSVERNSADVITPFECDTICISVTVGV